MRMAIWHAGNTMSNILSGFLAAGILTNMDEVLGLHSWQWFFSKFVIQKYIYDVY